MVFSGLYPIDTGDYDRLKEGLEKLKLNDSSLVYEPETSLALGNNSIFRCLVLESATRCVQMPKKTRAVSRLPLFRSTVIASFRKTPSITTTLLCASSKNNNREQNTRYQKQVKQSAFVRMSRSGDGASSVIVVFLRINSRTED